MPNNYTLKRDVPKDANYDWTVSQRINLSWLNSVIEGPPHTTGNLVWSDSEGNSGTHAVGGGTQTVVNYSSGLSKDPLKSPYWFKGTFSGGNDSVQVRIALRHNSGVPQYEAFDTLDDGGNFDPVNDNDTCYCQVGRSKKKIQKINYIEQLYRLDTKNSNIMYRSKR